MSGVMYKNMVLTIPDLVLPTDIPRIIDWFLYYNIADISDVSILRHPEPEYYADDRTLYGYAVIEIKEWYNNKGSRNFYKNIVSGTAKMVYDDPQYWEVEFYEPRTQEEKLNVDTNMELDNVGTKLNMVPLMLPIVRQNACILPAENTIWGNGNDFNNMHTETMFVDYNSDYDKEEMLDNKPNNMETQYNYIIKNKRKSANEFVTLDDLTVKKNNKLSTSTRDKEAPSQNVWMRRLRLKTEH
tara:strand:- start:668 stop:1393 length:726 start_codon:yes stop_codon:yes gene_type:complete